MEKSQAVAELTAALTRALPADEASALVRRALRSTGLTHAQTVTPQDTYALLCALAAEGGPVQELAEYIAVHGLGIDPRAA
jgi:hypothetical protein